MSRRSLLPALAALILAGGVALAGCAPDAAAVTITITHSAFDRPELRVPARVPVTFTLVNEDPIDHEWLVGDAAFHDAHRTGSHAAHGEVPTEVTVPALETATTTITFDEPGSYAYICHLPGHEAYGMVGVLTVDG